MEKEVETALRFERIEVALLALKADTQKNADATAELLEAWKSSKWIAGVVKFSAGMVVLAAAAHTAWQKLWG